MKRIIVALAACALLFGEVRAASTIDPTQPSQSSPLTSGPVRNNFVASRNDITNILGVYAGTTSPANPVNLQSWVDTTGTPVVTFKYFNANNNIWVPYATLNVNTNVYSSIAAAGSFLANPPLTVNVVAGVVTYGLAVDGNFAFDGGGHLALASVASGHLIANCASGTSEPGDCTWTAFADKAISASNGSVPFRTGGAWTVVGVGTSGATLPLLNSAALQWAGVQTIYPGTSGLQTAQSGTLVRAINLDGTITRAELNSYGAASQFSGARADGTAAAPSVLVANDEIVSVNAFGYSGSGFVGPFAGFRCFSSQTWSGTTHGTYCDVAVTANTASAALTGVMRFENDGGVTIPSTVTGGSKGAGTINTSGLFVNGVAVSAGSIVNSGVVNQLAWYSANGATVSGLATANSGVLITSAGGVPSISTTLPSGIAATNMVLTTPTLGAAIATTIAIGGASLGGNALAINGTTTINGTLGVNAGAAIGVGIISSAANALYAGPNGSTNPAFNVDASTASSATGLNIKSNVAGGRVSLSALSSSTNEILELDAKGTTGVVIGSHSSGGVNLASAGGGVTMIGSVTAATLDTSGTIGGSICRTSGGDVLYISSVNCFTSGAATSLAPGTTTISPTVNGNILFDNVGIVGEKNIAGFLTQGAGIIITGTTNATISATAGTSATTAPNNPTVTTVNNVMMGIGQGAGACVVTPSRGSKMEVTIDGFIQQNTSGQTVSIQGLRFGTGTGPANGAALAGTVIGTSNRANFVATTSPAFVPFSVSGVATGLTPGVGVWFDVGLAISGGTGVIGNVTCSMREVL